MYNPYSDWSYPTQGLQAQEWWYAQQQPRYGARGGATDAWTGEWGRSEGHHPPGNPISNLEHQTVLQYQRTKDNYYHRTDLPPALLERLKAANEGVLAALRDDSITTPARRYGLFWSPGYRGCLERGRADAGVVDKQQFTVACFDWNYRLTGATNHRSAVLGEVAAAAQTPADARQARADSETDDSLADQTDRPMVEAKNLNPEGSWWDETPEWVKKLLLYGGAGVAGLVTLRVVAPALLGTYLGDRQRRELDRG